MLFVDVFAKMLKLYYNTKSFDK